MTYSLAQQDKDMARTMARLLEIFDGDEQAVAFLKDIHFISHVWDDLVDGDGVVPMNDRHALCLALAKFQDQPLTREVALQIVRLTSAPAPACLPLMPTREQIETLERHILAGDQVQTPTTHYFAPGLYARQMFIPANTVLTGDVHKTEHLAIFVGDITVWTDEGMKRLTGHHTFVSKPGAKRVGYAHADTWCTGFFPTDKTDVAELERELVENPHLLQCNRDLIEMQAHLIEGE